jgi:hypothetical protein
MIGPIIAEIVPIRRPLTSAKALELIQGALADTGRFLGWTDHAIEMMRDKHRGIQDQQVLTVLREATDLEKGPTWDDEHEDWVCVLHKFVSGRNITVVIGINATTRELTVMTTY